MSQNICFSEKSTLYGLAAGEFGFVYCREREPRKRVTETDKVELLSRCSAVALLLGTGQKARHIPPKPNKKGKKP